MLHDRMNTTDEEEKHLKLVSEKTISAAENIVKPHHMNENLKDHVSGIAELSTKLSNSVGNANSLYDKKTSSVVQCNHFNGENNDINDPENTLSADADGERTKRTEDMLPDEDDNNSQSVIVKRMHMILTAEQLSVISKEDIIEKWNEQELYIKYLQSSLASPHQVNESKQSHELERLRSQLAEIQKKEQYHIMRLATKEHELQELGAQVEELKSVSFGGNSLKNTHLDPAVNLLFERMKRELDSSKSKLEETQNELAAWKFTPDSNTGKQLMAKCRLLIKENEELGKMISSGRLAKLEGELALQKSFGEELKKSQSELEEFLQEMDEDTEGMQGTILFLQSELRLAKEKILQLTSQLSQGHHVGNAFSASDVVDTNEADRTIPDEGKAAPFVQVAVASDKRCPDSSVSQQKELKDIGGILKDHGTGEPKPNGDLNEFPVVEEVPASNAAPGNPLSSEVSVDRKRTLSEPEGDGVGAEGEGPLGKRTRVECDSGAAGEMECNVHLENGLNL